MNGTKTNPKNDRIKREYLIWLKEAKQRSAATVEQVRYAIDRLETYTGFKDFGTFNKDQALGFKQELLTTKAKRSGKTVSISTVHYTLQAIKDFLAWLHGRKEYRPRLVVADIAYLNLTTGEQRQAHASRPSKYASLDEYKAALFAMPAGTEVERRDQAVMALLLLTCMRDAAVVSLKLRHLSMDRQHVFQDPREVKTKFSKTIDTFFYPVGDDIVAIVQRWERFLVTEKLFGPDEPLFPKTLVAPNAQRSFTVLGVGREHWSDAAAVRKIFRSAFERVGLPYVVPHSVRHTLTQLSYKLQLNPEQFKVWSQNMGHDKPLTTLNSYGQVSIERQAEIMVSLRHHRPSALSEHALAEKIAEIVGSIILRNAAPKA